MVRESIAQSPSRTITVPPAPPPYVYGEPFPNLDVPPEYLWYRFRASVTESNNCQMYSWTSQPQFICRLPTATPTRTSVPPTVTPTGTGVPPTVTTAPTLIPTGTPTATPATTSTAVSPSFTPTITITATLTACTIEFTDVPEGSTFYSYMKCMACLGIINGYATGCETGNPCFRPNNNITRGQLSKIVANAAGFTEPVSGQIFFDVPPDHTFYEYIERMASRGIITGYSDGSFRPGNNATRGQISKVVANAAGFAEPVSGQTFSDVPPTHTFYEFIERLAARGIISGYSDGTFRPANNATHGQTAKTVSRVFFAECDPSRAYMPTLYAGHAPFSQIMERNHYLRRGGSQPGEKTLDTILAVWPLVTLAPGLK